jgi:tetratricopeptide (TPR) repeat protein
MTSNLDELLFGSRIDPLARLRLDGACLSFALLEPSSHEAEVFFLVWFHEAHRIAAPLAQQAAPPVWRQFVRSMILADERLQNALEGGASMDGLLLEGLRDDARMLGSEWIRRGQSLREAIDAAVQRREGTERQQARTAMELLAEAAAEAGIERLERLREAAQILHTLLAEASAGGEPILRLLAGWTSMERGFGDQALVADLFQACLSLGSRGGAAAWFAGRTLAEAYRRQERWAEAAEALAFALSASQDPETRWATAAALADAQRIDEATRLVGDALRTMPSLAAAIWAVPSFEPVRPRLGLVAAEVARNEQQRAREALAQWRAEIERSRAGLAQAGLPAELPPALERDWPSLSQSIGDHPLQDRYVAMIAGDRFRDLQELVARRLTAAYDAKLALGRGAVE